ncbi:MAG: HEAT repeat domain-containing protein [Thermoguttaceae bacterium]
MFTIRTILTVPLMLVLASMVNAAPELPTMDVAEWVWTYPDAVQRGGGEAYFRTTFRLDQEVTSAKVYITADNGYELLVNNRKVAEKLGAGGDVWGTMNLLDIAPFLVPNASNVIAIKATCLGGSAGLIASFRITLKDGTILDIPTGPAWRATEEPAERWWEPDHNDSAWTPAAPMGKLGIGPWRKIALPTTLTDPKTLPVQATGAVRLNDSFVTLSSLDDYDFPAGVVFIEGRAPDCSTPLATTNFRIRETRAYWENDVPAPSISGPKLYKLVPARPDGVKTLLLDAGEGLIGSPIASFDGNTIYFCMAKHGVVPVNADERIPEEKLSEAFFHIYQIDADGKNLKQLTDGLWHDTDPCPLPDGSIVFSSTRTGARDEYHANAAHSLYKLNPDGHIEPITVHVTADADPELMADGRIAFVRHDNFLERAKVETHIHCVRPDGTAGEVIIGPDRQAIAYDMQTAAEHDALWLRSYGFGSPAPLPDGRVVALSHSGPVITTLGTASESDTAPLDDAASPGRAKAAGKQTAYDVVPMPCRVSLIDLAPLPDGRLVVSTMHNSLAVVDPETGVAAQILKSKEPVHSVVYLGERATPHEWVSTMSEEADTLPHGFLYAANVFNSKQTQAEWERVKAVRVWRGEPMTLRAALHQYGHVGSVGVELGTVPLMPDGSFYVEVPADVPLAMQAVDAAGRAVVSELSWVYTRPGEFRSCIGCHAERSATSGSSGVSPSIHNEPLDLTLSQRPPRFRANNGANGGVLNLQIERMRETISVDLYTDPLNASTKPTRNRRDEYARIAQELASNDGGTRFSAIQRLNIFRPSRSDAASVPLLRAVENIASTDDNATLRTQAALALSAFGTDESIAPLVALLGDEHPSVVQAANVALEHITGRNVLMSETTPETFSRGVVARSADDWKSWLDANPLPQIEATLRARVVPREEVLSRDESLAVRFSLESLARIGHAEKTAAAVRNLLKKRGNLDLLTQLAAVRVLGELGDVDAIPLLTKILRETCRREMPPHQHNPEFGWAAMRDHLGGAAIESLTNIVAASPAHRREVLDALQDAVVELGEFWFYTNRTADHPWLMGSVSGIIQFRLLEGLLALEIQPSEVREKVVERIVSNLPIDSDRGILLESDAYETLTSRLLWQVDAAPRILDAALDTLLQHDSGNKELSAAVVVSPPAMSTGELDAMSRAAQWVAVLASGDEPKCRDDERFGSRIRAAFEVFRHGEPSRMRSWTCFMLARGLGRLGDAKAAPVLVAALTNEPTEFDFGCYPPPHIFLNRAMTPVHRAAAADALGRIGDASSADILIAVVNDTKNMMDVRQAAAWGLGHLAARHVLDADTLRKIEKLAADYPEFYTRRALGSVR